MRINWTKELPEAYKAMLGLEVVLKKGKLDPKLKELVKIRASQINGCAFCLDMHIKDSIAIGESIDRINLLPAWHETEFYSTQERAALAWCESLTKLSESGVPDELFNNLKQAFSDEEVVELTLLISTINAWNILGVGFRLDAGKYISRKGEK